MSDRSLIIIWLVCYGLGTTLAIADDQPKARYTLAYKERIVLGVIGLGALIWLAVNLL